MSFIDISSMVKTTGCSISQRTTGSLLVISLFMESITHSHRMPWDLYSHHCSDTLYWVLSCINLLLPCYHPSSLIHSCSDFWSVTKSTIWCTTSCITLPQLMTPSSRWWKFITCNTIISMVQLDLELAVSSGTPFSTLKSLHQNRNQAEHIISYSIKFEVVVIKISN